MSESPPKKSAEQERRASQTAVDAGLASEEDAAVLGKKRSYKTLLSSVLTIAQRNWVTNKNYEETLQ